MKRLIAGIMVPLIAAAMCLCVAGCMDLPDSKEETNTTITPPTTEESIQSVVDANNRFALELYRNIAADEDGNIFFSPFSISSGMAISYEGARGETADEIRSVFHFPDDDEVMREGFLVINDWINTGDPEYSLNVINALWAEKSYPFLPEYIETASRYYSAETTNLDFINSPEDSASIINNWADEMTKGRIKNLIPSGMISDQTRLVLTNSIYFKATWETQFDEDFTHEADFWITPEKFVKVQMMKRTDYDARYRYIETEDMQVLEMPYKNESMRQLSMIVILPKNNDLPSVENRLDARTLSELRADMALEKVDVYMPKFRMETEYLLSDSLKEMGMPTAFSTNADFSVMDGSGDLYIREVIHKAFVEVYEEGTEAAAATMILLAMAASVDKPPVFLADHPFIFLIQDDETGNILFMGRVTDPSGLLPPPSPLDSLNWTIDTMDNEGRIGYSISLALDKNGYPHISYIDKTNEELKYAAFDGKSWKIETVDSEDKVGGYSSLALDGYGDPHISYIDETNKKLKYAAFDGKSWKIETVDSKDGVGYHSSLVLDRNGNPHVCYRGAYGVLKYAAFDGNSWITETVDTTEGYNPCITLEGNGNPHISYLGVNDVLKSAVFNGNSWKIETWNNTLTVDDDFSFALDSNGNPHVCWMDENCLLKYAFYDGQSWNVDTVDSRGGFWPSLALDRNDKPHICYLSGHSVLKYAICDGDTWSTGTVDRGGNYPSLALDSNGNPHIGYYVYKLKNDQLMHASCVI